MQIYHYDRETGEYLGATSAPIDPMASKREGKEVHLIPACSTVVAPLPDKAGFTQVFKKEKWEYAAVEEPEETKPEPKKEPTKQEIREGKIRAEMQVILRRQAIESLITKGELTEKDRE
jgi:ribosomal protein L15